MERALYLAASGMLAELARQDVIANNLANINTPGYKRDQVRMQEFSSFLLSNRLTGQAIGTGSGGVIARSYTDMGQGALNQTSNPLDVGVDGPGFLVVRTPGGRGYTRGGHLLVGAGGVLQDESGRALLSTRGQPLRVTGDPAKLAIAPDGTVSSEGRVVGQLQIVSLANPRRAGGNLWAGTPGADRTTQVLQSVIEESGVDPEKEMTALIVSQRSYESSQRVLRAFDELLQKSATIGSLSS